MKYERIELPFEYDALEPYIDELTVKYHYEKHHKSYEDKLNAALEGTDIYEKFPTIELLMKNYQKIEEPEIKIAIRQFGGGLINHNFLWENLKKNTVLQNEDLINEINEEFGSVEKLEEKIIEESLKLFGSGWTWLVRRKEGGLKVIKTFNQDNPWFLGFDVLIAIDNWEHAYYLKHNADKMAYLQDIIKVINWEDVEKKYLEVK